MRLLRSQYIFFLPAITRKRVLSIAFCGVVDGGLNLSLKLLI